MGIQVGIARLKPHVPICPPPAAPPPAHSTKRRGLVCAAAPLLHVRTSDSLFFSFQGSLSPSLTHAQSRGMVFLFLVRLLFPSLRLPELTPGQRQTPSSWQIRLIVDVEIPMFEASLLPSSVLLQRSACIPATQTSMRISECCANHMSLGMSCNLSNHMVYVVTRKLSGTKQIVRFFSGCHEQGEQQNSN